LREVPTKDPHRAALEFGDQADGVRAGQEGAVVGAQVAQAEEGEEPVGQQGGVQAGGDRQVDHRQGAYRHTGHAGTSGASEPRQGYDTL
jgi:hypothetical protein